MNDFNLQGNTITEKISNNYPCKSLRRRLAGVRTEWRNKFCTRKTCQFHRVLIPPPSNRAELSKLNRLKTELLSRPALPSGHKTAASPSRFVVVSTNLSSSCVFDWKTSELGNFLNAAAVTARQLQSERENEFVIQVLWVVYGPRIAGDWHCLYIKFKFRNLRENLDFPRSYQFRCDSNTTFKCS